MRLVLNHTHVLSLWSKKKKRKKKKKLEPEYAETCFPKQETSA